MYHHEVVTTQTVTVKAGLVVTLSWRVTFQVILRVISTFKIPDNATVMAWRIGPVHRSFPLPNQHLMVSGKECVNADFIVACTH